MEIPGQLLIDICDETVSLEDQRTDTYKTIEQIDVIENPISYEEFFRNYLLPNRPCLLDPWAPQSWPSRKLWATEELTPNLAYLEDHFGDAQVPVANCNVEQYSSHPKEDMTMKEYVKYLRETSLLSNTEACLYLKDCHFTREFPEYEAYKVPVYFCSDWLNESWDSKEELSDDYRFVYIGPKGSWTPFHTDVFKSYSWSANIVGCKKWILFPPGEEKQFKDKLGNLAYDLTSEDVKDKSKYPDAFNGHRGFEVIQKTGQVLFVPSGWHHQVWNLEDTISINHNWYNGCNIDLCWTYIKSCLRDVQKEIADCKDMEGWHQQCQLVLRASCGMEFSDFLQFLQLIANNRITSLSSCQKQESNAETNTKGVPECQYYGDSKTLKSTKSISKKYYNAYGKNHALFDLNRVILIIKDFVEFMKDYDELDYSACGENPTDFLNRLLKFNVDYEK